MSRAPMTTALHRVAALATVAVATLVIWAAPAHGLDPHVDSSLIPKTCSACHEGHGMSTSPMLPTPQRQLCLDCHGTAAGVSRQVTDGRLSAGASPPLVGAAFDLPVTHPVDMAAFSRWDVNAVTCTSCHSPHRRASETPSRQPPGRRKFSPRSPSRFEYELCEDCHGSGGSTTQSLTDISRLTNPANRSFHPIETPTNSRVPSIIPALAGREVNCTDCHGNSNPTGPLGPHGSSVDYLLLEQYVTADGNGESAQAYGLCYRCHNRSSVLNSSSFPEHRLHVVEERASCATCHSAHGSIGNRALIRFGEETIVAGVTPSQRTGRLQFLSNTPGSGTCYLTCHGEDHSPETYGPAAPLAAASVQQLLAAPETGAPESSDAPSRPQGPGTRPIERDKPPPPR